MAPTALYLIVKNATLYFQPVIFAVGFLGNLMSFFVFLSAPMRKFSSNLYLAALSFCNGGFSFVLLLQWLEMVDIPIIHMQGFCQAIVYLSHVFSFLSAWFVVCIAIENYIIGFYLSKAITFCTVFRAKIVIGMLTLFALALYGAVFRVTVVQPVNENVSLCTVLEEFSELNKVYFFLDLTLTLALPVLATTLLINIILIKNKCNRSKMSNSSRTFYRSISTYNRLTKITKVLIVISLTYVTINAPSCVNKLRLVILSEGRYTETDILLQQLFQLISYVSICTNVLCYFAFGSNFRKTVKESLCCSDVGKRQPNPVREFRNTQLEFTRQNSEYETKMNL